MPQPPAPAWTYKELLAWVAKTYDPPELERLFAQSPALAALGGRVVWQSVGRDAAASGALEHVEAEGLMRELARAVGSESPGLAGEIEHMLELYEARKQGIGAGERAASTAIRDAEVALRTAQQARDAEQVARASERSRSEADLRAVVEERAQAEGLWHAERSGLRQAVSEAQRALAEAQRALAEAERALASTLAELTRARRLLGAVTFGGILLATATGLGGYQLSRSPVDPAGPTVEPPKELPTAPPISAPLPRLPLTVVLLDGPAVDATELGNPEVAVVTEQRLARLVDELTRAHVGAILFDLVFPKSHALDPSFTASISAARQAGVAVMVVLPEGAPSSSALLPCLGEGTTVCVDALLDATAPDPASSPLVAHSQGRAQTLGFAAARLLGRDWRRLAPTWSSVPSGVTVTVAVPDRVENGRPYSVRRASSFFSDEAEGALACGHLPPNAKDPSESLAGRVVLVGEGRNSDDCRLLGGQSRFGVEYHALAAVAFAADPTGDP